MLAGRDIICISSIDWDFIWQGHQQIMATLAANGNRVLFIENTGVRSPSVGDLGRVRARLKNWWRGTKGFRLERERLYVYSPLVLPLPYSRIGRAINARLMMRSLRRWMQATDFHRGIVWTFLPTPLARDLIRALDAEVVVYYCIDDLASSSLQARKITASEIDVFREADLVFVTSEKLRERASRFNHRVHLFPFGVNFREFERIRTDDHPAPADLRTLPRPVIGYVGGLHQWIDQDLLASVARAMPDASFALVGPPQGDVSTLAACANVHILGQKAHEDVPRYVKHFDVALVPYRLTEYTANVYPTKLNEYLAMGTPVVATDLPEIRRLNAETANVVSTAAGADAFVDAIRAAVADGSDAQRRRRIQVARTNGWDGRIMEMSRLIDEALSAGPKTGAGWEQTLRRLYRVARRRIVAAVAVVVIAVYGLFYTPLVWSVAAPLRLEEPPHPADAIVVFAGGVGESGQAGGGYQERLRRAVDLYEQGFAPRIIISSGFVFAFKEAEVMRGIAIDNGVPAQAIVLETRSANTRQNVVFTNAILKAEGWRNILLVSSPYHMRRALLTWRKAAPDVVVTPEPVANTQFYFHDPGAGASLTQIRGILQEYAAIFDYWWKGWI
jgi:uncharacterized SAM-binding protein YcdF (DUF218 family)/glycosyltransferase involved in cell wall biosynthesis